MAIFEFWNRINRYNTIATIEVVVECNVTENADGVLYKTSKE